MELPEISGASPKDCAVEGILWHIKKNQLSSGDRLPAERDLCAALGVSRTTLRAAIASLLSCNVLESQQGSGTFVCTPKPVNIFQVTGSYSDSIEAAGKVCTSQVLEARVFPADDGVARKMGLDFAATVFYLHRIRLVSDTPVSIEHSYVNYRCCPGIERYDFSCESLYTVLENVYGVHPEHGTEQISITHLTRDEAELLQSDEGDAAYYERGVQFAPEGVPMEYCKAIHVASRYRFASSNGDARVREKVGISWLTA